MLRISDPAPDDTPNPQLAFPFIASHQPELASMNTRLDQLSTAEKTGITAFLAAGALLALGMWLFILPLASFLLCCLLAPFIPNWGFFLPATSRGDPCTKSVALTFDDGPDPRTTTALLEILEEYNIKATFFVLGFRAKNNRELIRMILERGHSIGNHTYSHDPFLMLKSTRKLTREIKETQQVLRHFGVVPFAFRPPVGITNPRLKKVLSDAGLFLVNFTRHSADLGNRRMNGLAERVLKRIKAGEIVLLHDKYPGNMKDRDKWLAEVKQLISGIELRGLRVAPLEELIERQVMTETDKT